MATETKGALFSLGFLGGLGGFLSGATTLVQSVLEAGVLPASTLPYVTALSGLLAIFGRLRATKKISGLL